MLTSLRKWLDNLPYLDPLQRQQAYFFQGFVLVISLIFAVFVAGVTPLMALFAPVDYEWVDFASLAGMVLALYLVRRGGLVWAVWLFIGGMVFWQAYFMVDVGLEMLSNLAIPIVLAGVLTGRRSLWMTVGVCLALVAGTAAFEITNHGGGVEIMHPIDLLIYKTLSFSLSALLLGVFLDWLMRTWRKALTSVEAREQEAQVRTRELMQSHVTLEQEMAVRHQVEAALREAEARYRTFIEHSSDGIWRFECDAPMRIALSEDEQIDFVFHHAYLAECNLAMARMYGFDAPSELVGARLSDLLPRADPHNQEHLRRFVRSGYHTDESESHELDRHGQPRIFLNNMIGIVEGDVIRQIWGIQRDITERRRLEAAEHEQRELAQSLRETAALLNSTLDLDELLDRLLTNVGRMVPQDASAIFLIENGAARAARIHGLSDPDAARRIEQLRFPLDERSFLRSVIDRQQTVIVADTRLEPKWASLPAAPWILSLLAAPIREQEAVIGLLLLVSQAPSFFTPAHAERLQAFADQASVAVSNAQLFDSAKELAALYRASAPLLNPGGDVAGLATAIAEAVTKEFDLADCGVMLVNETVTELTRVARAGQYRVIVTNALPLSGTGLTVAAYHTQAIVYAADVRADPRYLANVSGTRSELACPLRVPDATQPTGYRVLGVLDLQSPEPHAFSERDQRILSNFAERAALALDNVQLLERLRLARRAAEEANQLKSEFLANTSHELRTPLTAILGSLDLVLADLCDTPEEQTTFLRMAHTASRNLLGIVNDLLDIAKIEAGKMEALPLVMDANAMLQEVEGLLRVQAEAKGLALEVNALHPSPLLYADPTKVRQILINVLGNAIKFTERGAVHVRLRPQPEQSLLEIRVQDTGIGIPADKLAKLFQPFVQADGSSTRRYGGTGLGLHISRRLAELMGGSLRLHSAGVGRGSEVVVTLPLAAPPTLAATPARAA